MKPKNAKRIFFRLSLGYAVSFTLVLAIVGILFRGYLGRSLDANIHDNIDRDWIAMKGFLRIRNGMLTWFYDRADPDQDYLIRRLQRAWLLTDAQGSVLQISDLYASLDQETPDEVRAVLGSPGAVWKIKKNTDGHAFLVRSGVVYLSDENHDPYFAAIGRSLAENEKVLRQFTQIYFGLIPIMVFGGCLLGSFIGGRIAIDAEQQQV